MLSRQETQPKQQRASRRRRPARPKKRKRKIDAWQAFQHAQGAGTKVGRGSTSRLSNMYRALSPEQFRYYKDIASAANVARNAGHRPFGPRKRKARVIVDGSNRIESLSLMAKRRARAEASARSKALLIKQKKCGRQGSHQGSVGFRRMCSLRPYLHTSLGSLVRSKSWRFWHQFLPWPRHEGGSCFPPLNVFGFRAWKRVDESDIG